MDDNVIDKLVVIAVGIAVFFIVVSTIVAPVGFTQFTSLDKNISLTKNITNNTVVPIASHTTIEMTNGYTGANITYKIRFDNVIIATDTKDVGIESKYVTEFGNIYVKNVASGVSESTIIVSNSERYNAGIETGIVAGSWNILLPLSLVILLFAMIGILRKEFQ